MFRKIIREIVMFVFYTGLIVYVLMHCFLGWLINCFPNTKIVKLISLIQNGLEKYTENTAIKIIRKLEKKGVWY